MTTTRLEAFSDGVLAIIITIMVLKLSAPQGDSWNDLLPLAPVFASYVISFIYVGIYWNNHHHLMQLTENVCGEVLWANLHLLFWLSLVPFATEWMGNNGFTPLPTAVYGWILLMAALAWKLLQMRLLAHDEANPRLRKAVGRDWKGSITLVMYVAAIPLAFVNPWIAIALYVAVAALWFTPDPRIEREVFGE
ncbi:TMEM175 family protein [Blastopirellula marina]|uniref:Integral membrane protein n=1 Tax=Blastopirellula marina DSM 3645 TaxID=314230 RepID=A3ZS29_9BACT|nr:TMEM175 family protein [Blastopirellula marina]EAQ80500.1 hypothetical protein DSM3645_14180 [Blastopirellula marina DSM 3645]